MMDECFNFPSLKSVMGDEPKVACEVRGCHQTCRRDIEGGKQVERKIMQESGHGVHECSGHVDEYKSSVHGSTLHIIILFSDL